MTWQVPRRTVVLAVLALLAGFVVSAPFTRAADVRAAVVLAGPDAVHPSGGATTRSVTAPGGQQQGVIGHAPVDLVRPAAAPLPRPRVTARSPRAGSTPSSAGPSPLGGRAPPLPPGD
jgi:hypothetical protein